MEFIYFKGRTTCLASYATSAYDASRRNPWPMEVGMKILLVTLACFMVFASVAHANVDPRGGAVETNASNYGYGNADTIVIPGKCAEILVRPAAVWILMFLASGAKTENLPDLGHYLRETLVCIGRQGP